MHELVQNDKLYMHELAVLHRIFYPARQIGILKDHEETPTSNFWRHSAYGGSRKQPTSTSNLP